MRGVLLFLEQPRGDDHVGIDRPKRDLQFARGGLTPTFRLANGIFIADDQGWFDLVAELQKAVIREPSKHKSYVAPLETFGYVGNALCEERIMAGVGRLKWTRRKEDNEGLVEQVCGFYRDIESGVVESALSPLHPVQNARSIGIRGACPTHRDAGLMRKFFQ
jgi:hypothetical protein